MKKLLTNVFLCILYIGSTFFLVSCGEKDTTIEGSNEASIKQNIVGGKGEPVKAKGGVSTSVTQSNSDDSEGTPRGFKN